MESKQHIQIIINQQLSPVSVEPLLQELALMKYNAKVIDSAVKERLPMVIEAIKSMPGERYECAHGRITLVKTHTYQYSDEILRLEAQLKAFESQIKAKKAYEIAMGAPVIETAYTARFNAPMEERRG